MIKENCDGCGAGSTCDLKFFSQESMLYASDSGGGARHHPTRAQHMLRGETLTWNMAFALLDALFMLKEDITSKSLSELSKGKTYT